MIKFNNANCFLGFHCQREGQSWPVREPPAAEDFGPAGRPFKPPSPSLYARLLSLCRHCDFTVWDLCSEGSWTLTHPFHSQEEGSGFRFTHQQVKGGLGESPVWYVFAESCLLRNVTFCRESSSGQEPASLVAFITYYTPHPPVRRVELPPRRLLKFPKGCGTLQQGM